MGKKGSSARCISHRRPSKQDWLTFSVDQEMEIRFRVEGFELLPGEDLDGVRFDGVVDDGGDDFRDCGCFYGLHVTGSVA